MHSDRLRCWEEERLACEAELVSVNGGRNYNGPKVFCLGKGVTIRALSQTRGFWYSTCEDAGYPQMTERPHGFYCSLIRGSACVTRTGYELKNPGRQFRRSNGVDTTPDTNPHPPTGGSTVSDGQFEFWGGRL